MIRHEAKALAEVKVIRDQAQAIQDYLRQQRYGHEAQQDAAELKVRAERRLGELLAEIVDHGGGRKAALSNTVLPKGITRMQSSRWQRIASLPEPAFEQHRRHLDESQRAMVAGRIARLKDGQKASQRSATSIDVAENTDSVYPPITQAQAGELLNVGEASVNRAKAVIEKGAIAMTPLFLTLALLPSTSPVVDLSSLTIAEAFALDGRPGRYRVVLDSEGDDGFYDCQGAEADGEGVARVVRFARGQAIEDNETTVDVVGMLRVVIHTGEVAADGTVFPGFLAIRLEGARRAGR